MKKNQKHIEFFEIYDSIEVKDRIKHYEKAEAVYRNRHGVNCFSDCRMFQAVFNINRSKDVVLTGTANKIR